jgi:hypothetical protein
MAISQNLKISHLSLPEGHAFTSPGLCGNALPWELSRSARPIPEGDEHHLRLFIHPLQG